MSPTLGIFKQTKRELSGRAIFKKSCAQVEVWVGPQVVAPPKSSGLKPKRIRLHPVKVRLSADEKRLVQRKAQKADLSVNAFIKSLILEGDYKPPLRPNVYRELFKTNRQLGGIATNINQMAHRLNGGMAGAPQAREFLQHIKEPLLETLGIVRQILGRNTGPMP